MRIGGLMLSMLKGFGGKLAQTKAGNQVLEFINERYIALKAFDMHQAFSPLGMNAPVAQPQKASVSTAPKPLAR
jgi:hypothetical protein